MRRLVRPYFQSSTSLRWTYDVVGIVLTHLYMDYTVTPFILMWAGSGMLFWRYVHVQYCVCVYMHAVCARACVCTCTCMLCVCVCVCACMLCVCVCVCMYAVCVCVCMCVHVCMIMVIFCITVITTTFQMLSSLSLYFCFLLARAQGKTRIKNRKNQSQNKHLQ